MEKCLIDWCGKELDKIKHPFEACYCSKCEMLYFIRDGIMETISLSDFKEWKEKFRIPLSEQVKKLF